jgi:hypothetical protein
MSEVSQASSGSSEALPTGDRRGELLLGVPRPLPDDRRLLLPPADDFLWDEATELALLARLWLWDADCRGGFSSSSLLLLV